MKDIIIICIQGVGAVLAWAIVKIFEDARQDLKALTASVNDLNLNMAAVLMRLQRNEERDANHEDRIIKLENGDLNGNKKSRSRSSERSS